jgi:hypothetical protein
MFWENGLCVGKPRRRALDGDLLPAELYVSQGNRCPLRRKKPLRWEACLQEAIRCSMCMYALLVCLSFVRAFVCFASNRLARKRDGRDWISRIDFLFLKMWTPHTAAPAPSCASPRASNSFFLSGSAHRQSDHQCSSAPLYPLAPQIKELQKRTCSRQPAWRARRPKTRGCQVQLQSCQGQKVVKIGQNRLRKQHSYFIRKSPSLSNCFFGHSLDLCSIWHYRTVVGTVHA